MIECTGAGAVVLDVIGRTAPGGIVCLAGVSSRRPQDRVRHRQSQPQHGAGKRRDLRIGQRQPPPLRAAAEALAKADKAWLARLITRRVPLARWQRGLRASGRRHQGRVAAISSGNRHDHDAACVRIEDYALIGDCETAALVGARRLDRLAVLAALRLRRVFRGAAGQARERPLADRAATTPTARSRGATGRTR